MWLTMIWNKWSNFLCLFIDVQIFLFAKLDLTEIPSWPDGPLYGCNCELYCSNLHGHGLTATTELHTPTGPIRIRTDRTPTARVHAPMPGAPSDGGSSGSLAGRGGRSEAHRGAGLWPRGKHVSAGGTATRPGRLQRRRGARSPLPTCHYYRWWADYNVSISL